MFDSLADRMRADEQVETKSSERYLRWAMVAIVSVLLFGGLYLGVRMLEG